MGAIGKATGGKHIFTTLFNERYIAVETEKIIKKIKTRKDYYDKKLFLPINKIYEKIKDDLNIIEKNINKRPEYCLKIITIISPRYYLILGVYNCFWRYFMEKSANELPKKILNRIGEDRNNISEIYPKLEGLIKSSFEAMGKKIGLDGDSLRCLTLKEIKNFLIKYKLSKAKFKELKRRKSGYLYLCIEKGDREYIFTEKNIIKTIKNNFIIIDKKKKIKIIKGHIAYPGIARGRVYNHTFYKHKKIAKYVLVAVMTRPDDIHLIKNSLAVITDEGSILSHAAIVCRELKKPCIIGTKIATQVLKDGDLVEVDADKGVVRII